MSFRETDPKIVGSGGTLRERPAGRGTLRRALSAAEGAGAKTEPLDLRGLGLTLEEYGPEAGLVGVAG